MDNKFSVRTAVGITAGINLTPPPFKMAFLSSQGERLGELFETDAGTLQFQGKTEEAAGALFHNVVERHSRTLTSAQSRLQAMVSKLKETMPLEGGALNMCTAPSFADRPAVTYADLAKLAAELSANEAAARERQVVELAERMWNLGWRDPSATREAFVNSMRALLTLWDSRNSSASIFDPIDIPMPRRFEP